MYIILLIKFDQQGFFNEAGGNPKQTMILFWFQCQEYVNLWKRILSIQ